MEQFSGQTLDRYQIIESVGRGQFGAVFKALDTKLERQVALKIIDAQLAGQPGFAERFVQFSRTAAALTHPTLVAISDFGQAESWFYLVTEFIQGHNLLRLLTTLRQAKRWLPLPEAVQLVRQLCQAIAVAHQHELWPWTGHPRNIFLNPGVLKAELGPELPYQPRLTDAGLARLHQPGAEPGQDTPRLNLAFMAPEQLLNRSLDRRSDVYTLGALLYLLTVGELPLKAKVVSEARHFHLHQSPLLPRMVRPDLPEELQTLIMQALATDPAGRFSSVSALGSALGDFFKAEAVEPAPPPAPPAEAVAAETSAGAPATANQIVLRGPTGNVRRINLGKAVLTIGRSADNDIVLDHPDVSRHHARLDVGRDGYRLTDLNSTNGLTVDDRVLPPSIPTPWLPGQTLYIADFRMTIAPAEAPQRPEPAPPPPPAPLPEPEPAHLAPALDRVSLLVPDNHLTVEPGQRVSTTLIVQNQGRESDTIKVIVEGLPAAWVLAPGPLRLPPGKKQEVRLSLQPPRAPESRAGRYGLTIRAISQEDPDQFATVEGTLTVTEYEQFQSEFQPQQIEAGRPGQLVIANQGNTPLTFDVRWLDRSRSLRFEPGQAQLTVPAGQRGAVEFLVAPINRHWLGGPKVVPFTAQVNAAGGGQTPAAEVVSRGLIPTWVVVLAVFPVLVACAFLAIFYSSRFSAGGDPPLIRSLVVEPASPQAGQPFTIRWQVEQAEQVALRPLLSGLDARSGQYTFSQGFTQTTNLTFVAGNRFGESEQPFVVTIIPGPATPTPQPLLPVVEEWSVFPTQITQGQSVTIRWRVSNAETVVLQPFGPVQPSGERLDNPAQRQVYTLIATNKEEKVERSQEVLVATPLPNAPRVRVFVAEPNFLIPGQTNRVRLTWETDQADAVTIQPTIGPVSLNGFIDIPAPALDIVYTLIAKNAGGESQAQIQIRVATPTPTPTLTPSATATFTPSPTFTFTPTPSSTFTPTPTPSQTFTPTPTPSQTHTPTPSLTPVLTATATLTATVAP